MSMCRIFSCVVGRECLLWPMYSIDKTLLAFVLLHFVLQGQTCLLLQVVSLDFLLWHSIPEDEKDICVCVCVCVWVLEGHAGLQRTGQLHLHCPQWLGHRLGLLWCWMVCLSKEPISSVIFDIAPRYCILDSFVDCESYFISSKGFFPTVVDKMVIWIKFTHSSTFLVYWFLKCQCSLLPSPVWPRPVYSGSWT